MGNNTVVCCNGRRDENEFLRQPEFSTCSIIESWNELETCPDREFCERDEVTYGLEEHTAHVQHYSEEDTAVCPEETSASMKFNRRKAAVQVRKGLVQREGDTAGILMQASDCKGEQVSEQLPTTTVINAISPPPRAPTGVAVLASDKNMPTQAH